MSAAALTRPIHHLRTVLDEKAQLLSSGTQYGSCNTFCGDPNIMSQCLVRYSALTSHLAPPAGGGAFSSCKSPIQNLAQRPANKRGKFQINRSWLDLGDSQCEGPPIAHSLSRAEPSIYVTPHSRLAAAFSKHAWQDHLIRYKVSPVPRIAWPRHRATKPMTGVSFSMSLAK